MCARCAHGNNVYVAAKTRGGYVSACFVDWENRCKSCSCEKLVGASKITWWLCFLGVMNVRKINDLRRGNGTNNNNNNKY